MVSHTSMTYFNMASVMCFARLLSRSIRDRLHNSLGLYIATSETTHDLEVFEKSLFDLSINNGRLGFLASMVAAAVEPDDDVDDQESVS